VRFDEVFRQAIEFFWIFDDDLRLRFLQVALDCVEYLVISSFRGEMGREAAG
jgi:hypothetical protein